MSLATLNTLALLIFFFGAGIATIGSIWLYVEAARVSVWWLVLCLFIPLASFVFFFMHMDRAFKPTLVILFGSMVAVGAALWLGVEVR